MRGLKFYSSSHLSFTTMDNARPGSFLITSAVSLCAIVAAGCGSLKFYPGEERPDSTIGRLLFNSGGADLEVITIDGVPHPQPGRTVELLPGSHRIEVKYLQRFKDDGSLLPKDNSSPANSKNLAPTRHGVCDLRFTIEAAQELYLFVDAGDHPSLGSSTPPTISLKEPGYEMPALYQERCQEAGAPTRRRSVS